MSQRDIDALQSACEALAKSDLPYRNISIQGAPSDVLCWFRGLSGVDVAGSYGDERNPQATMYGAINGVHVSLTCSSSRHPEGFRLICEWAKPVCGICGGSDAGACAKGML